jgi:hypothetical protein
VKTFSLIEDESLNGGIARWAAANDVERMIDITAAGGVEYAHRAWASGLDAQALEGIGAELQVDVSELVARSTPIVPGTGTNQHHKLLFYGTPLPSFLVEKRTRRFAPAALAASPHHRALWDVRLFPFCPEHWQILLDQCGNPDCDGQTGWRFTSGIEFCEHCMFDLRTAAAIAVPEDLRPDLRLATKLISPSAQAREEARAVLPAEIVALGAANTVDLLMRVMPVVDRRLPTSAVELLRAPPLQLCAALAGAWRVLATWPDGMSALASDRIAGRTGRHNDGNGGRTMRFITPKLQLGAPKAVMDLILAWRCSVDLSSPEAERRAAETIPAPIASRVLKLDDRTVVAHRRERNLTTRFVLDLGRPEGRLDAEEVSAIVTEMDLSVGQDRARLRLGMARYGVEQLVAMNLLEAFARPFLIAHYGAAPIASASLDLLEAAMRESVNGSGSAKSISLAAAMKGVGASQKPWGPALLTLLGGGVEFSLLEGSEPLTRRIMVDPAAALLVAQLALPARVAAATSPYMSKADAGEVLNLNPTKTTALLKHLPTPRGSHDRLVPLAEVERLGRIHIASIELALRRGVDATRAYWEAIEARVPVLGPGGFCRRTAERIFL